MNSKSSFFSAGLFKDALLRIWPACVAYVLIVLMVLLPMMLNSSSGMQNNGRALLTIGAGPSGILTIVLFSFIVVVRSFSYLFVKNGAEFYGSLPVSRTAMFVSRFSAAFLSLVVCNVVIAAVLLVISAPSHLPFVAIATVFGACCIYVFIFSAFAALCVMLSGRRGISFLLYLMLNGYFFIVWWGLSQALNMTVYGWRYEVLPDVTWASPAAYLCLGIIQHLNGIEGSAGILAAEGWALLGKYALAAVVAVIVSWLLLKARKLESAGDALAFSKTRPVVTVAFALAAGLGFALFVLAMMGLHKANGLLLFGIFVVAAVVAFAIIESVMARSIGIMKKRVKGTAVVACCGIAIAAASLVGVQSAMCALPAAEDVECAQLPANNLQLSNQEDIQKVIDLQKLIIDMHENTNSSYEYSNIITLTYKMKDGSEITRGYDVRLDSEGNLLPAVKGSIDDILSSDGAAQWYAQCLENWGEQSGDEQSASIYYDDISGASRSVTIPASNKAGFVNALEKDIVENGARPDNASTGVSGGNDDYAATVIFDMQAVVEYDAVSSGGLYSGFTLSEAKTPETVKWLKTHFGIQLYHASEISYSG